MKTRNKPRFKNFSSQNPDSKFRIPNSGFHVKKENDNISNVSLRFRFDFHNVRISYAAYQVPRTPFVSSFGASDATSIIQLRDQNTNGLHGPESYLLGDQWKGRKTSPDETPEQCVSLMDEYRTPEWYRNDSLGPGAREGTNPFERKCFMYQQSQNPCDYLSANPRSAIRPKKTSQSF